MKSYLISSLARRFGKVELTEFSKLHPHAWLLWEPGAWRPARRVTLVIEGADPGTKPSGSEALALALEAPVAQAQLKLGRGDECELCLNDATLSQQHLLFMQDDKAHWTVRDTRSRNGSWLDGAKMPPGKPFELKSGARVRAGDVLLTFYTPAGMLSRVRDAGGG